MEKIMSKVIALLLAVTMAFGFASCSKTEGNKDKIINDSKTTSYTTMFPDVEGDVVELD